MRPLRILGELATIAVVAIAMSHLFGTRFVPQPLNLLLWLVGGALIHDLVVLPAYVAGDRVAQRLLGGEINHLRVPLVISALVLLVYFPGILDRQPGNYLGDLGHPRPDYLMRWVWLTVALFAASALTWLARRGLAARPRSGR